MKLSILVFIVALLLPVFSFADTATLNWTDNSGKKPGTNDFEDGFRINRNLNGGPYSILIEVAANVITYTDNSLLKGLSDNVYCYNIVAYNKLGSAAPSNDACYTVLGVPLTIPAAASGLVVK